MTDAIKKIAGDGAAVSVAGRQLGRRITGSLLVFLSLGAIVVSLGAPGLGWVLSGVTLIAASICSPLIGRTWLLVCMVLALVLLLTFGPLGYYDSSPFEPNLAKAAFTFGPLTIGLVALLVPFRRRRS